jgi:hypothetical protein
LLEGHPDQGEQHQGDDLDDREIDRREQAPQPTAGAREEIGGCGPGP